MTNNEIIFETVRASFSAAQLAELVGVDQALVSRWVSGRVKPSPESMQKLREVLL